MPVIKIEIEIKAPIERVFDLARCIELHEETMSKTNERAVDGVTKGLINLGETVTWQATHFGVKQKLTSKITEYDRPFKFRDIMLKGAFKSFTHDHFFEQRGDKVLMKDIFDYESPFWIPGKIYEKSINRKKFTDKKEQPKTKIDAGFSLIFNLRFDQRDRLLDLKDRFGQSDASAFLFANLEIEFRAFLILFNRFDFVPARRKFAVGQPVFINPQNIFAHHQPAEHRQKINREKRRREKKVADILPYGKYHEHSEKKQKRYYGNYYRALQIGGRDGVKADEFT